MISPIWLRPAIGQLFRGGISYNNYLRQLVLFGLFKNRDGDIGVIDGLWKTRNSRLISEAELVLELEAKLCLQDFSMERSIKVLFDEYSFSFKPLNGWNEFLYKEIRMITCEKYIDFADSIKDVPVGINIRCGNDFANAPSESDYTRVGWLQKTPIPWFVQTLRIIRKEIGYPVQAVVVSDGTQLALKEILEMENVFFLRPGCAITDLLVLSRSKVFLGSASSTFSAWASFFGQMPTANAPGHPLTEWGIDARKGQFIGDFDPRNPSDEFLQQAFVHLQVG